MRTQKLMSRKDLAMLMGVSVRTLRDNERRLGLHVFRVKINSRVIMYQGWLVVPYLELKGILPS